VIAQDPPAYPPADALTSDGRVVQIREVDAADAEGLDALHRRAGAEQLRSRFFTSGEGGIDREVERLTRPASDEFAAIVALEHDQIIGVASYERHRVDRHRAEFAVFVDAARHGRGIGTLLLERLADLARHGGITYLSGDILASNLAMLKVMCGLSPDGLTPPTGSVVSAGLSTAWSERDLAHIAERDRLAEQHSLTPLLEPKTVAVVGAGRDSRGIGHRILRNIIDYGFTGEIYPIHPTAETVAGQPAYASFSELPGPVDLVVVAVPAAAVTAVVDAAGRAGAHAAVIISSGFSEAGDDGAAVQRELVHRARSHGMRLVGPNCLGLINTDARIRLAASFAAEIPRPGGLALASQSGAVGIAVLHHAAAAGIGVHSFVSLGNKADVSGNDLLAYWQNDPDCRAVCLYLESFGNPRKFAHVARSVAREKPVLAVKSGRSAGGRRAGASHTAAAAAPDVAVDALFAQAGVIRTDTLGELLDAARVVVDQPLPAGNRAAIVGNAGGINVLAADSAENAGLSIPRLSPRLSSRLDGIASGAASVDNPIDLGAAASPQALRSTVDELAASGEIDAIVMVFAATGTNDVPGSIAALSLAADGCDIPMAAVVLGMTDAPTVLGTRRVPVFDLPERAIAALGHAADYAAWRRAPRGRHVDLPGIDATAARDLVTRALIDGGGWLPPDRAAALLSAYGIPAIDGRIVTGASAAVEAAGELGYPVVLKAADPALVHKTERHAVHVDLRDAAAVRAAYDGIAIALADPGPAVLVQPMVKGTVEMAAGVVHDPLFGSLVLLGMGGVNTEVLDDRVFRLLPLTDVDATGMWRALRAAPLLTGYRGSAPVDIAALEDLILRLGRLAEDVPEIAELDLNPIIAGPEGVVAVDAKLRLAALGTEVDPVARLLRAP
jgi:acyl-CoA synthetase (NDP forming)/GNAT superfamily N-acetyltransferase